jgi:hypothetical protein
VGSAYLLDCDGLSWWFVEYNLLVLWVAEEMRDSQGNKNRLMREEEKENNHHCVGNRERSNFQAAVVILPHSLNLQCQFYKTI